MSELRFKLTKNEFLMDKVTKKMWFVVAINMHGVILRDETDAENQNPELRDMPKQLVNRTMIKVNPDVMKVLYGDKKQEPDLIAPTFDDGTGQ